MERVPLISPFVCSFCYPSPLYCLFSFTFLWWASGWVTVARSGKLEEFFAGLFKLLLVFLCQVPGAYGCGSPFLPLLSPQSTVSVQSSHTQFHPQCKNVPTDPTEGLAALNCFLLLGKEARAKQWGAKCKIQWGVIGCYGKDSKATTLGETVTKCLPKSLLTACGYEQKQLWISASHKHLHYKFSQLSFFKIKYYTWSFWESHVCPFLQGPVGAPLFPLKFALHLTSPLSSATSSFSSFSCLTAVRPCIQSLPC